MTRRHIAYICIPVHGHIDWGGVTETLVELKNRGHRVTVLSGAAIAKQLEEKQLDFYDVGIMPTRHRYKDESISQQLIAHQTESFCNYGNLATSVWEISKFHRKEQIDLLLGDPLCKATPLVSSLEGLPYAILGPRDFSKPDDSLIPHFLSPEREFNDSVRNNLDQFNLNEMDLPIAFVQESPLLNIVFSSPQFEAYAFNKNYSYVGSDPIPKAASFGRKTGTKHVLYSSGTMFWDQRQVSSVLSLVEKLDIVLHFITAGMIPEQKVQRNSSKIRLHGFVDDKKLLSSIDVMICQGGVGTVTNGIRAGIPMIVTPVFFANEPQAKKVSMYGNGIGLIGYANQEAKLHESLHEVLYSTKYQEQATRLYNEFSSLGGSNRAADLIEEVL